MRRRGNTEKRAADPERELRQQFRSPPDEYGFYPGWWWEGEPVSRAKLTWQLEQFKAKGAAGTFFYQRYVEEEPYALVPGYRTREWWELFRHAVAEHRRLGMQSYFSDWAKSHTAWDEQVLGGAATDPRLAGKILQLHEKISEQAGELRLAIPEDEDVLCAVAHRETAGKLAAGTRQNLIGSLQHHELLWHAPAAGWRVSAVTCKTAGLDLLNPAVIKDWIRSLWQGYADKLREFLGHTFRGMVQDEFTTLTGELRYSPLLLERFTAGRGYDPRPHLLALFRDVGPESVKIRCDYYGVIAELQDENVFRTISDWFEQRGLVMGTVAFWGRQDVLSVTDHYGDVFRLLRRYAFPGCEDPQTSPTTPARRRFFDAKLNSSAAHIYGKHRTAVCAYWGTGWGMSPERARAWTNENYCYGLNLYNPHLGNYSLGGGWYEYVPPDDLVFQPYWAHYRAYGDYVRRLSFLLSQGTHVADAAVLFPTTTLHANYLGGRRYSLEADLSACETNNVAESLYARNVDFDFVDDDTLCRAEARNGRLTVAGIEFRAVVLPPLTTIRLDTLRKIKEFYDRGGMVLAFRRLPGSSAERGQDDPELRALLSDIFGIASSDDYSHAVWEYPRLHEDHFFDSVHRHRNGAGGVAVFMPGEQNKQTEAAAGTDLGLVVSSAIEPDVRFSERDILHLHQRIGDLDVYLFHNARPAARAVTLSLRTGGQPSIWDAFTGKVIPHHRFQRDGERTSVRLAFAAHQAIVVGFRRSAPAPAVVDDNLTAVTAAQAGHDGVRVRGYSLTGGSKTARVAWRDGEYCGRIRIDDPPAEIPLAGRWEFRPVPTRDNRWADYRYPATTAKMGPEARRFQYAEETSVSGRRLGWHKKDFDDSSWPAVTFSFGPYWQVAGPFADGQEPEGLLNRVGAGAVNPGQHDPAAGGQADWRRLAFSMQYGHESKDVHQQRQNGLTGVSDRFLVFDRLETPQDAVRYLQTTVVAPADGDYDFVLGGAERFPARAWIDGEEVVSASTVWIRRSDQVHVTSEIPAGTGDKRYTEANAQPFGWTAAREMPDRDNVEARVRVRLNAGPNTVAIRLVQVRGAQVWAYAVFLRPDAEPSAGRPPIPRLRWFLEPTGLVYDVRPAAKRRVGWYRFEAPPGLRAMKLNLNAVAVTAWVNGRAVKVRDGRIDLGRARQRVSRVALRVEMQPGCYAGAAFPEPVAFECASGSISLGDWCEHALESYSGGAVYARQFVLANRHLAGRVFLDLGRVGATAAVRLNGKQVGIGLGQPYRFDVTDHVRTGDNRLEITVYNTLANHYSVGIPSKYVFAGQTVSGLLGPVRLCFAAEVELIARPVAPVPGRARQGKRGANRP